MVRLNAQAEDIASIKIDAYQSAGLVMHTRKLAELTRQFSNQPEVTSLATAVIVMAAAALEALLAEAAYMLQPELYKLTKFRKAGVPQKFKLLKRYSSPDIEEIWGYRNALSHAEPDNPRTRYVGEKLNEAGALEFAATIEKLAVEIWGAQMPDWFVETTGLNPKT
jgi:hypothetical protein